MTAKLLSEKEIEGIRKDRKVRIELARNSHLLFFTLYLSHYLGYEFADFHREMFAMTEDEKQKLTAVIAFRDSGKSTIMNLSNTIWSVTGKLQKKHVLTLSQTQQQAKEHLANIKRELESNELLKADIGPFESPNDEWASNSIILPKYGARITAASTEQSIRGTRHLEHRPDLVVCDDVEDLDSVRTQEGRDKTYNWLTGEVLPVGSKNTKYVLVGNLLHEDGLMMRVIESLRAGRLKGKYGMYPISDADGNIAWPGKFKSMTDIEELKASNPDENAWAREYELRITSDSRRVIQPSWILYYDTPPSEKDKDFRYVVSAVDLAISQKESADYTAIVSASVYGYEEDLRIYIQPNPVNERLSFPDTIERIKLVSKTLGNGTYSRVAVEDVGYQRSVVQQLETKGIPAIGVKVAGHDKRARLAATASMIRTGKILFSKEGNEDLTTQLTNFGVERHDDLADAFSILVMDILANNVKPYNFENLIKLNRGDFDSPKAPDGNGSLRIKGVGLVEKVGS